MDLVADVEEVKGGQLRSRIADRVIGRVHRFNAKIVACATRKRSVARPRDFGHLAQTHVGAHRDDAGEELARIRLVPDIPVKHMRECLEKAGATGDKPEPPRNVDAGNLALKYPSCRTRWSATGSVRAHDEISPAVMSIAGDPGRHLTPTAIYRIAKEVFLRAADALAATDPVGAATLRRASTHWLRHSAASHQADAGTDIRFIQRNLRHASIETTGLYLHAEDDHRSRRPRMHTPTNSVVQPDDGPA